MILLKLQTRLIYYIFVSTKLTTFLNHQIIIQMTTSKKILFSVLYTIAFLAFSLAASAQSNKTVLLSSAKAAKTVSVRVYKVDQKKCLCASPFKDTREFNIGLRGGVYCTATSKSGKKYKRYIKK